MWIVAERIKQAEVDLVEARDKLAAAENRASRADAAAERAEQRAADAEAAMRNATAEAKRELARCGAVPRCVGAPECCAHDREHLCNLYNAAGHGGTSTGVMRLLFGFSA